MVTGRSLYRLAIRLYSRTPIRAQYLAQIEKFFKDFTADLAQVRNLNLASLLAKPNRWHGKKEGFGISSQMSGAGGPAGAVGAFVHRLQDRGDDRPLFAVSAGHVLTENGIWQPPIIIYSPAQGELPDPATRRGVVDEFRLFRRNALKADASEPFFDPSLDVDAGLVLVDKNLTVSNRHLVPDIGEVGAVADIVALSKAAYPNAVELVKAAGGTPIAAGTVTAIGISVDIEADARLFQARDLIEVVARDGRMAGPGDSGTAVLARTSAESGRSSHHIVGLVVAGSSWGAIFDSGARKRAAGNGAAYVLPFKTVTDSFKVELA